MGRGRRARADRAQRHRLPADRPAASGGGSVLTTAHFHGRLDTAGTLAGAVPAHDGIAVRFRGYLGNRAALEAILGPQRDVAALVAAAYRKWGAKLQQRLTGEYSLLAFDIAARNGVLTHDALGIGPLFYADTGDGTAFATDLLDLPGDALDDDYFADYLATGYIRTARTPYRGVARLLPGETVVLTPAGARPCRTWNLADVTPLRYRDPADYQHHLRELLRDGVAAAMGATGTTWIALSGGLDSSTVAVLAAAVPGARVGAYSLVSPGHPEADESRWMQSVVRHTGIAWHAVDVATVLPFSRLPDRPTGEPTTAVIGTAQIDALRHAAAAGGVTTLLTGNGGDAVLAARAGPIPTHLADPLFRGAPLAALRDLGRWHRAAADRRPWTYWASRALVRPALAHLRGRLPMDDRRTPFPDWLAADYVRRADLGGRDGREVAPRCRTPGEQAVWDTLWQGALSLSLAGTEGFAFRHPLLHRPLVEFMQAIPWAEKLRPRCDRLLQRRALKGILPDDVRRRSTKALGSWPFVEGLARSAAWQDYLGDSPRVADLGFTTRAAWRQAVAQAAAGHTGGDRFFLTMVAIECWLRTRPAPTKRGIAAADPVSSAGTA